MKMLNFFINYWNICFLGMALEDVVSAKLVLSKLGGLGGTPLDVL